MNRKRVLQILTLVLIGLAMWGVGIALHRACVGKPATSLGWVSIAGYDSEGYLKIFCDVRHLFSGSFRHPLMMLETLPVFVVGGLFVDRLGLEAAKIAMLFVFAAAGALGVLLQYLIARRLRLGRLATASMLCLWLSFAHVWIVGGLVESFGLSQLLLLGTVYMVAAGVTDGRAWTAMAVLAGGMTLTNGLKPVLAWFFGTGRKGFSLRRFVQIAGLGFGVALLGALALMFKWAYVDGMGVAGGTGTILHDIAICMPSGMTWGRRLWLVWQSFWCEPIITHGGILASDGPVADYASVLPHVLAALLLVLCVVSAVVNFRHPVVRAILAMFSVDFILHVVIGWGIAEGQIYCAHWFWSIPILVGMLPGRWAGAGMPLAIGIALLNML